jgi:death on curing protein
LPSSNRLNFKHRGHYFPTVLGVTRLHDKIVAESGGLPGTKNPGLLESAINKVVVTVGGEDPYPTLFTKTAAIGYSIVQNHVFNDANKRTGLETMMLILQLNGYRKYPPELAHTTLALLIANGFLEIPGIRMTLLHWQDLSVADTNA